MRSKIIIVLVLVLGFSTACEEEVFLDDVLTGFWIQDEILEDGVSIAMDDCEASTRMLIEQNGVYRLYSSCDTMDRSGTWLITNDTLLDLSMDRWNGSNKYEPYPVRFSILTLNDSELELRITTFIGERKKMVLFTPLQQDSVDGLSDQELLDLDRYNKSLKTYTYRFKK